MDINEKINKKECIIEASAKVFANKGKAGARMKDIATEAGVSSALLHYHYKNKDELYYEVLKYYIGDKFKEANIIENRNLLKSLQNEKIDPMFKDTMINLINSYNNFFKTHKYFTRLLVHEMSNGATILKLVIKDIRKKKIEECKSTLNTDYIEKFKIKNEDYENRFHVFISILSLIISHYTFSRFFDIILEMDNLDKEKFYKERINHIINHIWKIIKN